ncbi:MAG: hypothetical protein IKT68_01740 [Clostridia bacterium]|nr:hypothetical protein [Clostridia bacterium]
MKRICLWVLIITAVLLVGCSTTQYQNDTQHMKVNLPDYMAVYDSDDPLDAALLKQYKLSVDEIQENRQNGCLYFALGTKDGVQRTVNVNVYEDDYTKEIWQLKEDDTDMVTGFMDDAIADINLAGQQFNELTGDGWQVINKGQMHQGDAFCIYLDIAPYDSTAYNSIYMATVYNGKCYSILYKASAPLTTESEGEAHDIFDTFYVTETLAAPGTEPENQSGLQAFLVVIVAAIVVALIVLVVRLFVTKEKPESDGEYTEQFKEEVDLMTSKKNKNKKDKRT